MESLISVILDSGRTAVELALYILLPIMVLMMALMTVLESKGVLRAAATVLAPLVAIFGVPGVGVFAMLQLLFVSFAAPVATLAVMERGGADQRGLAATLAMVLAMSQGNAVFPLVAVGLDLPVILMTSLAGGLIAAAATYYAFARRGRRGSATTPSEAAPAGPEPGGGLLDDLLRGGRDGLDIVVKAVPVLVIALFIVNGLGAIGVIPFMESILDGPLDRVDLPGVAAVPLATKYLAGGTAMMGVTIDLVQQGALSAQELNRLAGLMINPLDIVGVTVLASAGARTRGVVRPAMLGAAAGIALRAVLHLVIF